MRILISGVCGFVGSTLAETLLGYREGLQIFGFDNFIRPGSETNRLRLASLGVKVSHGDVRSPTDIGALPQADWVIDAAANPSVLAGLHGESSQQVVEHNLFGTVFLLEYCKRHGAGIILLSTSRVYSIPGLSGLEVEEVDASFRPVMDQAFPSGITEEGVSEEYSTAPPISLYGSTKIASEALALEYGEAFQFPAWINRCGVLAGAGQFGRADQGIFSFWINSWLRQRPLEYIGFGGTGFQVRDCLHPRDLTPVLLAQVNAGMESNRPRTLNFGGGRSRSLSLSQLSRWCERRFGKRNVSSSSVDRPYDIPWMVLDSRKAEAEWNWTPRTTLHEVLEEIASHAEAHPDWLRISNP